MFSQDMLIALIDAGGHTADGQLSRIYEKYCGKMHLEDLFTTDTVYICAHRAASGFMGKRDTQKFMRSPWLNSYRLCQEVLAGKYKPGYYRTQVIMERGKARVINPPDFRV